MRIAIITYFYKPVGGGIPRYVDNISKKLAELGNKVDIITASYGAHKVERDGRITTYRLPCMDILAKTEKQNRESSHELLRFLRNYLKRKPDVILAQNVHALTGAMAHTLAINMAAIESNVPLILTLHSFIQEDEYASLKIGLMKNLHWQKIISVGSNLAESMYNLGAESDDLVIIPPPVDIEKFNDGLSKKWLRSRVGIGENETLILHAGRVDSPKVAEEKGVFTLLKALASIKDKDVKVLFACPAAIPAFQQRKDETIDKIKKTAKLLKVDNRIFIETFDQDEMHHVYSGADLYVMASQMESFGLVFAEALACGIPVIGTSVGGIPEIIEDGKSGELVPPNDHVQLSKTIRKVLNNRERMKKMGQNGRKHVEENFELDRVCRSILGTCESVIKRNKKDSSFFSALSNE